MNIYRENNMLHIYKLDHPKVVSDFLQCIFAGRRLAYNEFTISFECRSAFPNAIVPIAGIIDYYKREQNIIFNYQYNGLENDYIENCSIASPLTYEKENSHFMPLDKVITYSTSREVADITALYVDAISHTLPCEKGVLDSLIWCINETMDNVLLHSGLSHGYVMGQLHPQSHHVALCIFDYGKGIYESLKNSKYHPRSALDAITLSLKEGVGDGLGMGNGLFGLHQIITNTSGRLTITSGSSSMICVPNSVRTFEHIPFLPEGHYSTTIDFQFDTQKSIDLDKILGCVPLDMRIDSFISDSSDVLEYKVIDNCAGTATRESGEKIRIDVSNTIRRTERRMVIDFSDIAVVSSSFADEFIGKLVTEFGFIAFNRFVQLENLSDTVRYICERAIFMRVHNEWEKMRPTQ